MPSLRKSPPSTPVSARAARRRAGLAADLPSVSMSEFDGVRYLHLGETPWVQGAMRLRKPRALELEYVQRMMAWLLLLPEARWCEEPAGLHVVQLGLGAASLTRFCHGELGARTTAVELNAHVVGACRQWFRLPEDDARLSVQVADAGTWVAEPAHRASADALCVDLYDQQAAAPVLDDEAFYAHCHEVLVEGGVLSVNLFGRQASFGRSARRIEAAFGAGQVRMLSPTKEGNTIVLALKAGARAAIPWPTQEELAQRAEVVQARLGLPAAPWPRLVKSVPAPRASSSGPAEPASEALDADH